ncbi:ABC transporter substrate-binding protein [Desulfitobacterium hafniense]|uniref:ABC transporter substrate-binding protein n=1 Tax=Desulfitobacterium hafniense TaxID=49338 RepID=UPI000380C6A3|nr:ABC transporter substrate-binding protein [Desulfitobacterium hafniense]
MKFGNYRFSSNKAILFALLFVLCFTLLGYSQQNVFPQENPIKTVGILMGSDLRTNKVNGVIEGLKKYGYEENVNIQFRIVSAKDRIEDLPKLAQELVKQNPDLLIGTGEKEMLSLQQAAVDSQTPIVFIGVGFAEELGLVNSYAKPGGNITGVDNYYLQLSGKRLEYFKRLLPNVQKVMVLYDETVTPSGPTIDFLNQVASQLDIKVIPVAVENEVETLEVISGINSGDVDGMMLLCSLLMESMTDSISPLIQEKMIPTFGVSANQTKKGFLASYGMDYREQGIQASRIVAKILQGQDPGAIPVEAPARVDFIINTKVAEVFKAEIDPAGFACASEFIR